MASSNFKVAVIGMSCRTPQAKNKETFWEFLIGKGDSVGSFPKSRREDVNHVLALFDKNSFMDPDDPYFTGSYFSTIDKFDAEFFDINPKEAECIDPQQRFFLRSVWEAVEDAGLGDKFHGSHTGIYVGNTMDRYRNVLTSNSAAVAHGNHPPFIASRVSYIYDLKGPALMVSTGCSSSLLAVHLACQGLLVGDCKVAIAGGITLDVLPLSLKTDIWNQIGITSKNQRCYAFDSRASGIAKGEGVGVVILKPLDDALRDGNHIYGVLLGSGTNQDGHSNGITAPHPSAQALLLEQVWERSGINPAQIDYFEAHGTGTQIGDPIEALGIKLAFDSFGVLIDQEYDKKWVGSVKANIGHLADGAAGVMSLIKMLLCLKNNMFPGQINFEKANDKIRWGSFPFQISTEAVGWNPKVDSSRIAAISSFGLVGTNVHVVLTDSSAVVKNNNLEFCPVPIRSEEIVPLFVSTKSKSSMKLFLSQLIALMMKTLSCTKNFGPKPDFYSFVQEFNSTRAHRPFNIKFVCLASSYEICIGHLESALASLILCDSDGIVNPNQEKTESVILKEGWLVFNKNKYKERACAEGSKSESSSCHTDMVLAMVKHGWVAWDKYYKTSKRLLSKSMELTYPFDEKRYWPTFGTPLFMGATAQAPALPSADSSRSNNGLQRNVESDIASVVKECICRSFLKVTGRKLEDDLFGVNLLDLGIDSLMMIELRSEIIGDLGNSVAWELDEVGMGFSGNDLSRLLKRKLVTEMENTGPDPVLLELEINKNVDRENVKTHVVSHAQKRLFVLDKIQNGFGTNNCAYNVANGLRIKGDLNPVLLAEAFKIVVSAHECLHSTFHEVDSTIVQKIGDPFVGQLQYFNLSHLEPVEVAEIEALAKFKLSYGAGFMLESGPLIRGAIIQIRESDHLFYVVAHHIVMDGASHYIFYANLWAVYKELVDRGQGNTELTKCNSTPSRYMEFVRERQEKENHVKSTQLGYWLGELQDFNFDEPCTVPGDKTRPSTFSGKGQRLVFLLEESQLEFLSGGHSATVFQKLLSLVYFVLYSRSGKTDLIVGSPVAGRNYEAAQKMIGFFVNMVALRVQLDGGMTLQELIKLTSKSCTSALQHADMPFDALVGHLRVGRDPSVTPVFSVSVCYHSSSNRQSPSLPADDWTVQRLLPHNDSAKWDLYFDFLHETEGADAGKFRFTLEYYSDLYSAELAADISNSLIGMLTCFNSKLGTSLDSLCATEMAADKTNLSIMYGPTRPLEYESLSLALYTRISTWESQVAQSTRASTLLSYADLLRTATAIAYVCRETIHLSQGDRVGILMDSSNSNPSLLACLFSGTTFVPLDVDSPLPRLHIICKRADCKLILFESKYSRIAERIRWGIESQSQVISLFCVDAAVASLCHTGGDEADDDESQNLMNEPMWNSICTRGANDHIQAGGWYSSLDGNPFSVLEMSEYRCNVYTKLCPYLDVNKSVLEIGCGSGLTTGELSHLVGEYVATDSSSAMVSHLVGRRFSNVTTFHAKAHDVRAVLSANQARSQFDVVVLNSVIHCFPSHSYLQNVLNQLSSLLSPAGVIFLGDILDLGCKSRLEEDYREAKDLYPDKKIKLDWSNELFISREYLNQALSAIPGLASARIQYSTKIYTVQNELTKYRFDALIVRDENVVESVLNAIEQPPGLAYFGVDTILSTCTKSASQLVPKYISTISAEDDAYILFTSGTTGEPKQVIINQQAILNYVQWATRTYVIGPGSVLPVFSKLTFDFTLTSLLCPLYGGGMVIGFGPFETSYESIAATSAITHSKLSPLQLSLLIEFCRESGLQIPGHTFIIGGEELSSKLLTSFKAIKMADDVQVFNEYGPTEATVGCIVARLTLDEIVDGGRVAVGIPIDNTGVFCCVPSSSSKSSSIALTRVGVAGTCGLFGINICSNAAQRECLVPGVTTGLRVFYTDDIISFQDNQVQYHGREKTSSAKINDVRVDMKEIVSLILNNAPAVTGAWLTPIHGQFAGKKNSRSLLGAFIQFKADRQTTSTVNTEYISNIIAAQLPRSWIPIIMNITAENPPMNRNGKVDYVELEALLLRIYRARESGAKYRLNPDPDDQNNIPPKVQLLTEAFRQVLNLDYYPTMDSNFFELGGDSIAVLYLVRNLGKAGIKLSYDCMYRHPTVRRLYDYCCRQQEKETQIDTTRVQSRGKISKFIPTPISVDYLLSSRSVRSTAPSRFALPVLGKFTGMSPPTFVEYKTCIKKLVDLHESFRSTFQLDDQDGRWRQLVTPVELYTLDVREYSIPSCANIVTEDGFAKISEEMENSLNIFNGPSSLFSLISVDESKDVYFFMVAHHLIVDNVSWNIVLEDFWSLVVNINCTLPSTLQISEYCEILANTDYRKVPELVQEVEYWTGIETELKATDYGHAKSTFKDAKFLHYSTDKTIISGLASTICVSEERIIMSMALYGLQSVWKTSMKAFCLEGHGRNSGRGFVNDLDLSRTVGWLTSRYPVLVPTFKPDFRQYVKSLDRILTSVPSHGVNYGMLKYQGKLRVPQIDHPRIMFVYLGNIDPKLDRRTTGLEMFPWIDTILADLVQGNFHQSQDTPMEFDLEIICWNRGNELKFGYLFSQINVQELDIVNSVSVGLAVAKNLHEELHYPVLTDTGRASKTCTLFPSFQLPPEFERYVTEKVLKVNPGIDFQIQSTEPSQLIQNWFRSSCATARDSEVQVLLLTPKQATTDFMHTFENTLNKTRPAWQASTLILVLVVGTQQVDQTKGLRSWLSATFPEIHVYTHYVTRVDFDNDYDVILDAVGYLNLARTVSRALFPVLAHPGSASLKMIAVDGDNTLWEGEAADKSQRLTMSPKHVYLQEFLAAKKQQGYLLLLLSKNSADDINHVFDTQHEMILAKHDFVAICADWNRKCDNLILICQKLNLSPNSTIFLDDSLYECCDMIQGLPNVLTLLLPDTLEAVQGLLSSVWALDSIHKNGCNLESVNRTELYAQEEQRKNSKPSGWAGAGLRDVLLSWKLKSQIYWSTIDQLRTSNLVAYNRAIELLQRTNQFKMNSSMVTLNDPQCDQVGILLASLSDEFGNYGIVSAVIFEQDKNYAIIVVKQWVISCRALNRGLETAILDYITNTWTNCTLLVQFQNTGRNEPAKMFLNHHQFQPTTTSSNENDNFNSTYYRLSAQQGELNGEMRGLIQVEHVNVLIDGQQEHPGQTAKVPARVGTRTERANSAYIENCTNWDDWIPMTASAVEGWTPILLNQNMIGLLDPDILAWTNVESMSLVAADKTQLPLPESLIRQILSKLWCRHVGCNPELHSNFFEQGGKSLNAVYLISELSERISRNIRLIHLMLHPVFEDFLNFVLNEPDDVRDERMCLKPNIESESGPVPLSNIQSKLAMIQDMAPTSTAYTETIAIKYPKTRTMADVKNIRTALLSKFPAIAQVIVTDEVGERFCVQKPHPDQTSNIYEESACDVSAGIAAIRRNIPAFSMNEAELFQFGLIHLTETDLLGTILTLHIHHILVDDVSLALMAAFLSICLLEQVKCSSGSAQSDNYCHPYALFVHQELNYLGSSHKCVEGNELVEYLKPTAANFDTNSSFLLQNWDSNVVYSTDHKSIDVQLNVPAVCLDYNVSPFQYFLGCYILTLRRYASTNQVKTTIPITTRSHPFQGSIGPFLNTLPLMMTLDMDLTIPQFFQCVKKHFLALQNYFLHPFEDVLSELRRQVKGFHDDDLMAHNMFSFYTEPTVHNYLLVPPVHAKLPMSMDVYHRDLNTTFLLTWAPTCVDTNLAHGFLNNFVNCCKLLLVNSGACGVNSVRQLDLMCAEETEALLNLGIKTSEEVDVARPVQTAWQLFERNSAKNPKKTALIDQDLMEYSYMQVKQMAEQLAVGLAKYTSDDHRPIILIMSKGHVEVVTSILALWSLGSHYLPVDSELQEVLLSLETTKNKFSIVLTNLNPAQLHPAAVRSWNVLDVKQLLDNPMNTYHRVKNFMPKDDCPAYMMMTSGSTGAPKKCIINHSSLSLVILAWNLEYNLESLCPLNVLQWAPFSFDVFMGDFAKALLSCNGTLVLISHQQRLDIHRIHLVLHRTNVTFAEFTPQFAVEICREIPSVFCDLNILVLGSDVLHWKSVNVIRSCLSGQTRLYNSYGLTEATIDSTLFQISNDLDSAYWSKCRYVPIGRPIANTNVTVLDPQTLLPCPVGCGGTLGVYGRQVGFGDVQVVQWNSGQRLFLTGDIVRWLDCGNLEFSGRNEKHCLKVAGFRVNPVQIETICSSMLSGLGVQESLVFVAPDDQDESILCVALQIENEDLDETEVRKMLSSRLPYYMIPQVIVQLRKFGLNSNGKLDMTDLRLKAKNNYQNQCVHSKSSDNDTGTVAGSKIRSQLIEWLSHVTGRPAPDIHPTINFKDQGFNSLNLMKYANLLLKKTLANFKGVVDLFNYTNVTLLAEFVEAGNERKLKTSTCQTPSPMTKIGLDGRVDKVCVVGAAFRLPSTDSSLSSFWRQLNSGSSTTDVFPAQRKDDLEGRVQEFKSSSPLIQGSFLSEIDKFDHTFFHIAPKEAGLMCPEQRILLEVATEAILDAGYLPADLSGRKVSVYIAASDIKFEKVLEDSQVEDPVGVIGRLTSMLPTRITYNFNLKGANMVIDSACSSALSAFEKATAAITAGDCELAIVGGVNIMLCPMPDGILGNNSIQSSDWQCRTFDQDRNGTTAGEGAFAYLLKPLSKAENDKNHVYCVIESCASNCVGRGNGITAPSVDAQIEVFEQALRSAQLCPNELTFVETHGTGTKLGDQIELAALEQVFGQRRQNKLTLTASKPNFGHLDACAGFLGILKAIVCLATNQIPPMLFLKNPDKALNQTLFQTHSNCLTEEERDPCYGMINAFGLSGTNCCLVVSRYVENRLSSPLGALAQNKLLITARDEDSLKAMCLSYSDYIHFCIQQTHSTSLQDLCWTASQIVAYQVHSITILLSASNAAIMREKLELLANTTMLHDSLKERNSNDNFKLLENSQDVLIACAQQRELPSYFRIAPNLPIRLFSKIRHWPKVRIPKGSNNLPHPDKLTLSSILTKQYANTRELLTTIDLTVPPQFEDLIQQFCTVIILEFLNCTSLKDKWIVGSHLNRATAFRISGIHSRYERLFGIMLRQLEQTRVIQTTEQLDLMSKIPKNFIILQGFYDYSRLSSDCLAKSGAAQFPAYADCFEFPLYCSKYYSQVLVGNMSPLSVIYPKGDLDFMYKFNKLGDQLGDVYYNMYIQLLGKYILKLAKRAAHVGATVRLLEVGAGMGYVTRQLAPKIIGLKNGRNIEYWFTDLGKAFVENGRKMFSSTYGTQMLFTVFDITRSAEEQGIPEYFDVVISYNVIHTTDSIRTSVENLRRCLTHDGILAIIESSKNETWSTLAWGILDGWWYFKDFELRPADPMLEKNKWIELLGSIFPSVLVCPSKDEKEVEVDVEKVLYICSNVPNHDDNAILSAPTIFSTAMADYGKKEPADDGTNWDLDHDMESAVYNLKLIWKTTLGVQNVDEDDVFQELGGESLLAIQMMQSITRVFGVQLEIAHVYAYPTLGALAEFVYKSAREIVSTIVPVPEAAAAVVENSRSPSKMRMLLFPGQGAQKPNMCQSMLGNSAAMALFAKTKDLLHIDILSMCTETGSLEKTDFVQLALFVTSLAKIAQLKSERSDLFDHIGGVSGLSVGEFAALVFAEAIEFEDGLQLVHKRGRLMQAEVEGCATGMVSVLGPGTEDLEHYLRELYPSLVICTYLGDNQHTVGGPIDDCRQMVAGSDEMKLKLVATTDVRLLRVAGAFHSKHMDVPSQLIAEDIERLNIKAPKWPIIMNVNGDVVTSPTKIKSLLKQQLRCPVLWSKSMETACVDLGIREFVEVSPSCVLTPIVKNRIQMCMDYNCTSSFIKI